MTTEMLIAIASLSLTAAGTTVGWILSASRAAASLQVRLQQFQDAINAVERMLGVQTERIDKLARQVELQNSRVRTLEIDLARHLGQDPKGGSTK